MQNELINMEIMVVDDTPNNLRLLFEILKEDGYKVRPVPNGKLALSAAEASPPDLILLDINMPDINGYEVCVQLKENKKTSEIPIIFLSAMNETIDKVKAFEVGGIDYITKPFHVKEVLARVKTHLKLYLLQRQLEETNNNLENIVKQRTEEVLRLKTIQHQIELDLKVAREIQTSILPQEILAFLSSEGKIFVSGQTKSARRVGGDFYDYCPIDEEKVFFCIGDVSGKGIPAALFMAIVKTLIRVEAKRLKSPMDIILAANSFLLEENDSCMFASAFCGFIDIKERKIRYCNAGHTAPLISKNGMNYNSLPLHKDTVVGILPAEEKDYFAGEIDFEKGDRMFLYSDGVTEAIDTKNQQFTLNRLEKVLNDTHSLNGSKIIEFVNTELKKHTETAEQSDDITMMIMEITEPPMSNKE